MLAAEPYCYLTTAGRVTGRLHTIEIWFAATDGTIYLLSGGHRRSDWVKNLIAHPDAHVRIGQRTFPVTARVGLEPSAERHAAVALLHEKYARQVTGTEAEWQRHAFIVALDLVEEGRRAWPSE